MMTKQYLDLNLIRILCAVVETGTVTQAALRLDMGISAVSYALNKLRRYYSDALFFRSEEGMQPTAIALELYKVFKPALDALGQSVDKPDNLKPLLDKKTIRIRCNSLVEMRLSHQFLTSKELTATPSLDFLYHLLNAKSRQEALRKKQTDIDIGQTIEDDSSIVKYPIYLHGTVLLCRKGHPRLGNTVTVEQLKSEKLVSWIPIQESLERETFVVAFDGYHLMNRTYRSSSLINLLLHVKMTDAVIFIPAPFADFCSQILDLRAVDCPFLFEQIYNLNAYVHKTQKDDPAIQRIIQLLTQWCGR